MSHMCFVINEIHHNVLDEVGRPVRWRYDTESVLLFLSPTTQISVRTVFESGVKIHVQALYHGVIFRLTSIAIAAAVKIPNVSRSKDKIEPVTDAVWLTSDSKINREL